MLCMTTRFQNRRAKENKKRKMIQSRQQKQEALGKSFLFKKVVILLPSLIDLSLFCLSFISNSAVTQQQPNQQQTRTQQSAAATTHLSPNYQQLESIYQYQMMTNTPFGILEPNINRIHSQEQQHGQPSNNNNKKNKGKGKAVAVDNTTKFNLPPISSIMVPNFRNLSIPFYFHHSKFGIEDCMLQWSTTMNSTSSAAAGVDHYSSLNSPITYGAAAAATLVGGSNY